VLAQDQTFAAFDAAMAVLSHVYFGPVIRKLIQSGVPDLLKDGPLTAVGSTSSFS
jgi:hypothetical protein